MMLKQAYKGFDRWTDRWMDSTVLEAEEAVVSCGSQKVGRIATSKKTTILRKRKRGRGSSRIGPKIYRFKNPDGWSKFL